MVNTLSIKGEASKAAAKKKLTPKRLRILSLIEAADRPLSAYEIMEQYNLNAEAPILAMSVYRILHYLESIALIVHLQSVNKYMANTVEKGSETENLTLFVICKCCAHASAIPFDTNQSSLIQAKVNDLGFQSHGQTLETTGVCSHCYNTSTTHNEENS